jgi:GT2 family glycosyltransferase
MNDLKHSTGVGVVIIGRNEGERLIACLRSLRATDALLVYVDSGSVDDSARRATDLGADVVQLSTAVPFTAARARNAGFRRLRELLPTAAFVQFVDGDCMVADGWIEWASAFLAENSSVAIICGRRKELHPERSLYNRLCDFEWDTPIGETTGCGGDFLVRAETFAAVGGFNDALIAGEEPELCHRLRRSGWRIYRADQPMTLHDAAIMRFGQWARRAKRSGYAYAARAALHWRDGYCFRENARIAFWAFALPVTSLASAVLTSPWFVLLLLAYAFRYWRLVGSFDRTRRAAARSYCAFVVLGNWPEFAGQLLFVRRWLMGRAQSIIEYK